MEEGRGETIFEVRAPSITLVIIKIILGLSSIGDFFFVLNNKKDSSHHTF